MVPSVRNLRSLWHFVQIAEAGSFTAAARRLSLSTAALSKSISQMEGRIGTRLFIRASRHLRLTDEGRALLENAGDALQTIENSFERVQSSTADLAGIVRLSTVTAFGKHCILPLLPAFFEQYPQIELVISFHDGGRGLTREVYDVRVNWGENQEQDKVTQNLCVMPLILVASPGYLAKKGTPRTPEELRNHACINVALPGGGSIYWDFLPLTGMNATLVRINPKGPIVVTDELDAVADAAACGLGITVSSAENILPALRDGTLVRLLEDYTVRSGSPRDAQIIIQYRPRRVLSRKVRVLVDFLLEELKGCDPLEIVAARQPRPKNAIAPRRGIRGNHTP